VESCVPRSSLSASTSETSARCTESTDLPLLPMSRRHSRDSSIRLSSRCSRTTCGTSGTITCPRLLLPISSMTGPRSLMPLATERTRPTMPTTSKKPK
ncbi:hypothetical protein PRIPAC_90905, partial [Pristionchus pacificus]